MSGDKWKVMVKIPVTLQNQVENIEESNSRKNQWYIKITDRPLWAVSV